MQADFPAKVQLVRKALGPGQVRLLDVGCGKGFFLKACAEAGIEATGVDLSSTGVAYARDNLHMKAMCGKVHDLKKELGTFDVITFWATIEHLPDPIAVLKDLNELLRPGGSLFCDTGIAADWLERLLPGLTQWYDPPQHLFVFSPRGITKALDDAGFTVVRLDPCFERTRGRRFLRITRNAFLAVGFRAFAWLGRMNFGTSFAFTRYPLGNLMTIEAVKRG
jgi:SAM-dependent methyltransferase